MFKIIFFLLTFVTLFTQRVLATTPFGNVDNPYSGNYNASTGTGFGVFISNMVSSITIIAGLGFLAYLIYGALRYLMSGGDEKAVGEAKKSIGNAFIGLLLVVLALAITAVIQAILGLDILHPQFKGT